MINGIRVRSLIIFEILNNSLNVCTVVQIHISCFLYQFGLIFVNTYFQKLTSTFNMLPREQNTYIEVVRIKQKC